ncbi:hypothetical protein [Jiangella mangrovi]|uniref:Uncharacterized protein n=1 Tax=Jiangella mangrovi TaxID=1524084 RepID=A0A7W9LJC8_9ACTN|nr:hypothetical protein [Jiangella mangrovi]MBB5785981.1 hypothetical protein [Jiangella mangrovi]
MEAAVKLTIVCTGRGSHEDSPRELGVVTMERRLTQADVDLMADVIEKVTPHDAAWAAEIRENYVKSQPPPGPLYERRTVKYTMAQELRRSPKPGAGKKVINRKSLSVTVNPSGNRTFTFTCPTCRKLRRRQVNWPLSEAEVATMVEGCDARGIESLDISYR